uniref:Uncharacterized protein n=1 Tax=Rhizophora mucronata TaxID=61149 RepID=A0A2P2JB47_RHIMU
MGSLRSIQFSLINFLDIQTTRSYTLLCSSRSAGEN